MIADLLLWAFMMRGVGHEVVWIWMTWVVGVVISFLEGGVCWMRLVFLILRFLG